MLDDSRVVINNKTLNLQELVNEGRVTLSDPYHKELIINILKKNLAQRKPIEIDALGIALKHITFFKENSEKLSQEKYRNLLSYIGFRSMPQGAVVCHYGEAGKEFYVILEGEIQIIVKNPGKDEKNEQLKLTEKELLEREKSLMSLPTPWSPADIENAFPGFHASGKINAGGCFGELALLENKRRQATIVCSADCRFGVLTKIHFQSVLKEIKVAEVQEKLKFLSNFKMFNYWVEFSNLSSIPYYLEERSFERGSILFKENDPVSSFYLLKSGEVEQIFNKTIMQRIERDELKNYENATIAFDFLNLNLKWKKKWDKELNEKVTYLHTAPSYFGEDEIVNKFDYRQSTVICRTVVDVYMVPKERVMIEFASKNKEFIPILSDEMRMKEGCIQSLVAHHKKSKIEKLKIEINTTNKNSQDMFDQLKNNLKKSKFVNYRANFDRLKTSAFNSNKKFYKETKEINNIEVDNKTLKNKKNLSSMSSKKLLSPNSSSNAYMRQRQDTINHFLNTKNDFFQKNFQQKTNGDSISGGKSFRIQTLRDYEKFLHSEIKSARLNSPQSNPLSDIPLAQFSTFTTKAKILHKGNMSNKSVASIKASFDLY